MGIGNQRGTQMRAMLTGRLLKEGAGYRGVETAANCPHHGVSRGSQHQKSRWRELAQGPGRTEGVRKARRDAVCWG